MFLPFPFEIARSASTLKPKQRLTFAATVTSKTRKLSKECLSQTLKDRISARQVTAVLPDRSVNCQHEVAVDHAQDTDRSAERFHKPVLSHLIGQGLVASQQTAWCKPHCPGIVLSFSLHPCEAAH